MTFEVDPCRLLDLRHPEVAPIYALAKQPWLGPLSRGEEPPSWQASDLVRRRGHVGMIDPSRRQPGLWHITLLRWNEADAPCVRQVGQPRPITMAS
jgi:hypothetical protein